jgi:hypothetical protein
VLDDLGGFINSFDLLIVFSILLNPGFVLFSSELGFRGEGVLVVFDVLGDDSNFLFSFSESVGGVLSQFGKSDDLCFVVSNSLFEIVDEFLAWNLVVFVDGVGSLLVTLDLGGDVVQEEVDLVDGSSGSKVQLDDGQNRVAQSVLVDLSKNLFGVLEFVLLGSDGECQC